MSNNYEISFLEPKARWNWVSVSSIAKETFDGFIDYLYNLDREIEILPYIPGGYAAPMHIREDLDKTYLVKQIVGIIKDKKPVKEIYKAMLFFRKDENYETDLAFIEDVYELYLSLGVPQHIALEYSNKQIHPSDERSFLLIYKGNEKVNEFINMFNAHDFYFPFLSRYVFVYMFRSEFIKYMKSTGYNGVSVDGGWVLNDKEREIKQGIIDENGNLL